jgi:hypothetical protein
MTIKFKMKDGSGEVVLSKVSEGRDRHGNIRVYVRFPGKPKVRLTATIGTQAFLDEYRAALAGKLRARPAVKPLAVAVPKDSLSWLIEQYYHSAEFKGLHERTQRVRRLILGHIAAADGDKP